MKPLLLFVVLFFLAQWNLVSQSEGDIGGDKHAKALLTADNSGSRNNYLKCELEVIPLDEGKKSASQVRISAFPNPIKQNITLLTFGKVDGILKYNLTSGSKKLMEKSIEDQKETIEVFQFDKDTYILSVTLSGEELRSFKIIKR